MQVVGASPWFLANVYVAVRGTSLVEFALVLPMLLMLVLGGISLFVRSVYRDSLDEAAEQAAWAAARTGGDQDAVQAAVQRSIPFVPLNELIVSATSTGYHAEVAVTVRYQGTAVTSLPLFNTPLADAQATATNQQERAFTIQLPGNSAPQGAATRRPAERSPALAAAPQRLGPAAWPEGTADFSIGGTDR
jgi:Flp pilus assembly protein TadG